MFKLPLEIRQASGEVVAFRVDESEISGTSNAGILEGTYNAVIVKNGTGDYTITLDNPSRRTLVVIGVSPVTVDLTHAITSVSASAVRVVFANLSGTDTNTDFHISLLRFDKDEQN